MTTHKSILLIDDEPDILEFLSYNFRKKEFNVITACNGLEGIKQAELISNKYKIIRAFLNLILNIDPSIAEKDACSFEHSISLESLQSMYQYLENHKTNVNNKEEQ